jgi:stage II sporulation protein P
MGVQKRGKNMIRIRTVNKTRLTVTIILTIIAFYLFSNALIITNKINFYINKQLVLKEIKSSKLVEGDFLKSHINNVLPIIKVTCDKEKSIITDDRDIRWFTEFVTGFDIKNPITIISGQILMMKKHEPQIIAAAFTSNESSFFNLPSKKEVLEPAQAPNPKEKNDDIPSTADTSDSEDKGEEEGRNITDVNISSPDKKGYEFSDGIYVKNEANQKIDISELLKEDLKMKISGKGPHVLIIHTHTSEAFTPTKQNNYTPSDPDRTENSRYNIVRVGEEIAKNLKAAGISVIHDKTVHDYPSYNGSYRKALETIESQLKKNPSIKIVLDIHRDALIFPDGKKLKVTAEVEKQKVAQVMLVVGTDQGGLKHPNWKENLKFALRLQDKFQKLYPGLARPINLAPYRYNQHTTTGSIIIEVGSNGNTLEEALASSKYIAKTVAEVIREIK